MANRSTFPAEIDSFIQHSEILSSDIPNVQRYQALKLKTGRTPSEESELSNLTTLLRDKFISAEDFNKFQDCLINMETFIKDEVEGYVTTKQTEFNTYVNTKTTEITNTQTTAINSIQATKDSALMSIEQKKENIITYLDSTTAGDLRNDIGIMEESTVSGASLIEKTNTLAADYVRSPGYGVTTGTVNTYAITLNPAPTTYIDGMCVSAQINVENTGTSTINVNGLGAKTIKKPNGNDVSSGNLKANSVYTLRYNGTNFILQGEGGSGDAQPGDVLSGKTFTNDVGDQVGTLALTGDAGDGNVLAGKTYYNTDAKTKRTGSMADYSSGYTNGQDGTDIASVASNTTVGRFDIEIPDGFHTKINAHILGAIPGNIKAGAKLGHHTDPAKQIAGTFTSDANAGAYDIVSGKSGYVNGNKVDGTLPIRGTSGYEAAVSTGIGPQRLYARIPQGAYRDNGGSGYPEITIDDANFAASNIRNGTPLFGMVGTLIEGKRWAYGSNTSVTGPLITYTYLGGGTVNYYSVTVNGLAFQPNIVVMRVANNINNTQPTLACIYHGGDYTTSNFSRPGVKDKTITLSGIDSYGVYNSWFQLDGSSAQVYNGGFRLPATANTNNWDWIAIE